MLSKNIFNHVKNRYMLYHSGLNFDYFLEMGIVSWTKRNMHDTSLYMSMCY